ncbi:MAG: hypothetical protein AB7E52_04825 [Bdellovibrionales bacterium]
MPIPFGNALPFLTQKGFVFLPIRFTPFDRQLKPQPNDDLVHYADQIHAVRSAAKATNLTTI